MTPKIENNVVHEFVYFSFLLFKKKLKYFSIPSFNILLNKKIIK